MAETHVPTPEFGPRGFVAPSEELILAGVIADIDEAFGGGLNPSLSTPQGQLASSQAAIVGQVNDQFVNLTNQVDPAYAAGRMQDAIGRIYFIERQPSRPTTVTATCVGSAGVVIPTGALARTSDGQTYACSSGGTIPAGGSLELEFACTVDGPVPCAAGTLTQIFQAIAGWDSIDNAADGVLGRDVESRAEFEARRAQSVAKNAVGSLPALQGSVLEVPDVLDAYVTENASNFSATVGGVQLAPNSLYVAAVGGDDDLIAKAIWRKKSPGCAYNGNTTIVVEDDNPLYSPPFPSYSVTFQRPTALTVLFDVTIVDSAQVPADAVALIRAAIIAAFAGADGGQRARIGTTVFASRFYGAVQALGAWAEIVSIKVGSINTKSAVMIAAIADDVMTVTSMTYGAGSLAVGQTIVGAGVLPGTKIVALLSGTGATGTYQVGLSQSVPSGPFLRAATADLDQVVVNINQAPAVADGDVSVVLA